MVFILFSASGPDFQASDFASKHKIGGVSVWSKGQPRRSGRLHSDAGLSVSLEESSSTVGAVARVREFIESNGSWLAELGEQPVELLIHLGMTVGETQSYAPSLEFDSNFLRLLVDKRISLHVSAYPTSDE